jgi:hypothetical protein
MSNEVREMLATLLDNIYGNWLDTISSKHGKKKEEIEEFINSGVYQVARLKEEGWITDLLYDDEVQIHFNFLLRHQVNYINNLSYISCYIYIVCSHPWSNWESK